MKLIQYQLKNKKDMKHIQALERQGLLEIMGIFEGKILLEVKAERNDGIKAILKCNEDFNLN